MQYHDISRVACTDVPALAPIGAVPVPNYSYRGKKYYYNDPEEEPVD